MSWVRFLHYVIIARETVAGHTYTLGDMQSVKVIIILSCICFLSQISVVNTSPNGWFGNKVTPSSSSTSPPSLPSSHEERASGEEIDASVVKSKEDEEEQNGSASKVHSGEEASSREDPHPVEEHSPHVHPVIQPDSKGLASSNEEHVEPLPSSAEALKSGENQGSLESLKSEEKQTPLQSSHEALTQASSTLSPTNISLAEEAIEKVEGYFESVLDAVEGAGTDDFGGVGDLNHSNSTAIFRSGDTPSKGREGDNASYVSLHSWTPWMVMLVIVVGVSGFLIFKRVRRNRRLTRFGSMEYSSPTYLSGDENILL